MKKMKYIFQMVLIILIVKGCSLAPDPIYTSDSDDDSSSVTKEKTKDEQPERIISKAGHYEGISPQNILREKMMVEIENLLGVPYRRGGRSPRGMDCSGFVNYVFEKSLNIRLPRQVSALYRHGEKVEKMELQFGDLIFFENIRSSEVSHVGIYLDSGQFVHASLSEGVVISNLNESYYQERYAGAQRPVSQ